MNTLDRRDFIKQSSIIAAGIALYPSCNFLNNSMQTLPNIVYVFPDQFRKQAMNFWSKPKYKDAIKTKNDPVITPNLDKFAEESLVLTNAISNHPLCSPHRGMLLSGLYPHKNGTVLNCNSNRPISSLREDVRCISDVLHDEGYSMGYFGKLHVDWPTPNDPENPGNYVENRRPVWDTYTPPEGRHGFDYWYSYGTFNEHKNPHYWDKDGKKHEPKEWSPIHEAKEVSSYIKNEKGQRDPNKPFFAMVGMNPPHSPYNSLNDVMEEDYNLYKDIPIEKLLTRENVDLNLEKTKSAAYYFASVTGVDRAFGMILKTLEETGMDENTIVVFASDHGETMCSQGINDPKNSPYSEAYDIPFIVRYPNRIKPGIENMILNTPDIMPTLLGLIGLNDKIPKEVQGKDFSKVFQGKLDKQKKQESGLYIKNLDGKKDAEGKTLDIFPAERGIRTDRYTLVYIIKRDGNLDHTIFFDNEKDPYQMNNIPLEEQQTIISELSKELGKWLKVTEDPWYENKYLNNLIDYPA